MSPTTTPATGPESITVKRNVFDLEKFERVTLEGTVEFTPDKTMEEATASAGNNVEEFLKVWNIGKRRMAVVSKRKALTSPNAANSKIVAQFVRTFSLIPPFSDMKENTAEERKAKRQAIYSMIRGNEMILSGIKAASAAAVDNDEDDEDDNE